MGKLRYRGRTGKFKDMTKKEILALLKDVKIPYKSKMTRFRLIKVAEYYLK
jgi:hypothetical protein